MKNRIGRALVAAGFVLVALGFAGLGCLYLVHAFYMWLASTMAGPYAALITAGLVFALAGLIVAGVAISRPRRSSPEGGEQARALGQAVGMAAASRVVFSLLRKISPRLIVMAVAAAVAIFLVSLIWRRDRDD